MILKPLRFNVGFEAHRTQKLRFSSVWPEQAGGEKWTAICLPALALFDRKRDGTWEFVVRRRLFPVNANHSLATLR